MSKSIAEIGGRDFFLSREWFDLIDKYCDLGGLPLFIENSGCVLPLIQSGRTLKSMTNYYTMRYAPVYDETAPCAAEVESAIKSITDRRWHSIELHCLPETEAITDFIADVLRKAGWSVRLDIEAENWFQPTDGLSPDAYFASRPSRVRHTVERKWRKANREHRIDFRFFRSPAHLDVAIAAYERIYSKSWKEPERFPEFIPALIRLCAARGILRLGILYVDDVPAAAHFWIMTAERATIYKLAYDEAYAELSVGSLLTRLMFDRVLAEDHPAEIDYGTGADAYKRDWMDYRHHLMTLTAYNTATLAGMGMAAKRAARRVMALSLDQARRFAPSRSAGASISLP